MPAGDIAMFERLKSLADQRRAYEAGDQPFTQNASAELLLESAAEIERLLKIERAATVVVETFEKDEAQGYRSKDRQFAIAVLRVAMPIADQQQVKPTGGSSGGL